MLDNWLSKIACFILTANLCVSCKNNIFTKNIDISLVTTESPVVLRYNKEHKLFWSLEFETKATITNNSFLREKLYVVKYTPERSIDTHISSSPRHYINSIPIVKNQDSSTYHNYLYYTESKEFILKTSILIDTTQAKQELYKRYKAAFTERNTDSIQIGTIKNLKVKHPEIIQFMNLGGYNFEFNKNKTVQTFDIQRQISF